MDICAAVFFSQNDVTSWFCKIDGFYKRSTGWKVKMTSQEKMIIKTKLLRKHVLFQTF